MLHHKELFAVARYILAGEPFLEALYIGELLLNASIPIVEVFIGLLLRHSDSHVSVMAPISRRCHGLLQVWRRAIQLQVSRSGLCLSSAQLLVPWATFLLMKHLANFPATLVGWPQDFHV